jgi:HAMP domain-containing protein
VLTSAALSIAGAAFVAWRRNRNPTDPMHRAVRAVARGKIA